MADSMILKCPACGAKNRVPPGRAGQAGKCGKCGHALEIEKNSKKSSETYNLRCLDCRAKNRVPADRLDARPKCGKCGALLKTGELFVPQPVTVTDGNFENQVIKSPLPVLLFAWAPWCPSCGSYAPIIDQFGAESKGKIRVGKVNIDANPTLASRFNILSVPYLFIFDNGQMKENMPGGLQKHELMLKLGHYL